MERRQRKVATKMMQHVQLLPLSLAVHPLTSILQARRPEGTGRSALALGGAAVLLVAVCAVVGSSSGRTSSLIARIGTVEFVPMEGMPDPAEAVNSATMSVSQVCNQSLSSLVLLDLYCAVSHCTVQFLTNNPGFLDYVLCVQGVPRRGVYSCVEFVA